MAFEIGTATDSNDLFAKFRTFITTNATLVADNEDWEELEYNEDDSNTAQLFLRGKGLADSDSIYVNVYKFLADVDSYNWGFRGATGHVPGIVYSDQPGASTRSTFMLLHNTTISYWFYANGRRFIIEAKVGGTVYQSCYCGFLLPYDLPTENPYPMLINATSAESDQRFSWINDNDHSSMDRGGYADSDNETNAWVINPAGQWLNIRSYAAQATQNNFIQGRSISSTYDGAIWPYIEELEASSTENYLSAPGGEYVLRRLVVYNNTGLVGEKQIFGTYDGVRAISGEGNASENTVTEGGDTYRVFQNVFRTSIADFHCVIEE